MISIDEAKTHIQRHCQELSSESRSLLDSVGYSLSQDIVSSIDSPPFDKSMMDGYAICSSDIVANPTKLRIIDRLLAGSVAACTVGTGTAAQIMTGAQIPKGADAVVMVEETSEFKNGEETWVEIRRKQCGAGQNVLRRGECMSGGDLIMAQGTRLAENHVGVLAEIGCRQCQVVRRPKIAVLATGDELVPFDREPEGGQIRNSNGPMLVSLARPFCEQVSDLGIAADDKEVLGAKINEGLQNDVLILTGGVSAGVADLVPGMLAQLGVERVFHKVNIKPGKPLWFGVLHQSRARTLVFGLPGNPVSSLVGFTVFIMPALRRMAGHAVAQAAESAMLAQPHRQRVGRTTYWPSIVTANSDGFEVVPLDWKGSADLKTLCQANALTVFPGDRAEFAAGERLETVRFSV